MMLEECPEAQLQVLDQPTGSETLVVGRDDLDDPDLAGLEHILHVRLERTQVITTHSARHSDAGYPLRHVLQHLDHRTSFLVVQYPDRRRRSLRTASRKFSTAPE